MEGTYDHPSQLVPIPNVQLERKDQNLPTALSTDSEHRHRQGNTRDDADKKPDHTPCPTYRRDPPVNRCHKLPPLRVKVVRNNMGVVALHERVERQAHVSVRHSYNKRRGGKHEQQPQTTVCTSGGASGNGVMKAQARCTTTPHRPMLHQGHGARCVLFPSSRSCRSRTLSRCLAGSR